ncbi:hypothetical protein P5673_030612 [Acropora cervicornis]|uniref:Uncharacterized protein n=1 Tax=Acropora cervicornis TaxID=6130 RepID=A0AAD9PU86_ACRCE|nr:hypothetical protein P5673_030612 [Acropora cervicornis]
MLKSDDRFVRQNREQCWEHWLHKSDNGLNNKRDEALLLLRNVAKSVTADTYHENVTLLKTSEVWLSNHHLQNWFEKRWLVEAKRWVWAFRQERFLVNVNTNNGIERQNESLKYQYLKDSN